MTDTKLNITATWFNVGSYSRFKTWNYADTIITNWLIQKGYCNMKLKLLRGFAKHTKLKCSYTDSLILAHQNFKEFREYANNYFKNNQTI